MSMTPDERTEMRELRQRLADLLIEHATLEGQLRDARAAIREQHTQLQELAALRQENRELREKLTEVDYHRARLLGEKTQIFADPTGLRLTATDGVTGQSAGGASGGAS